MSDEEVEAYYKIYELNYADKVNNYFIDAVYRVYSYIANKYLPIHDIENRAKVYTVTLFSLLN